MMNLSRLLSTAGLSLLLLPQNWGPGSGARAADRPATLRQAAAGHCLIGTAVSPQQLDDPTLGPLIAAQFDSLTAENAFKPDSLEREKGQFTWGDADKIAAFAAQHHQALIGHTLCWHQQSPAWLYADADGKPLPRAQALANLHDYITAVMTHFKGKVKGWDVVNEALADGPGYLRDTPARRAIGDDFIQKAFEFAHAADPKAELYYNDYGIESPGKREKALRLVRELKAAGVHIDAVGIQAHAGLTWPPTAVLDDAVRQLGAEGVRVSLTELDMDVLPRASQSAEIGTRESGADPYKNGAPPAVLTQEADRYTDIFGVLLKHPGTVERVTLWGVSDGQSWLNNFPVRGRTNYPLLFDRQDRPKPAFDAVVAVLSGARRAPAAVAPPKPAGITAEQDHQNMMDQLHITSLRPGAEGFNKDAPNYQNTDESKATVYPHIPDPLVMANGKKVTTARQWWTQRRPQLVEAFDRELYGRVPKNTPKVTWQVLSTTRAENGGVPVLTRKIVGHVDNSSDPAITVDIHLSLSTPANATGPVPVMLEFGFPEGWPNPFAALFASRPRPAGPNPFAPPPGPTWQQQCLARGYGYAVLDPTSVQADNGAGLTQGIIGLCNHGKFRTPDQWGALRAWAWGADRVLDYFGTDRAVDAKQVGIEGLSRYGKATLVTMAYDPRFAIAFVGSSGEGGAKLWRRNYGETEGNIAGTGEYHWMAGNFLKYDGPLTPGDLPVDSDELIALCAPRPVFISCGSPTVEGTWLDDRGMFLATVLAGPVYRLLGKKDLGTTEMPPIGAALISGDLAWRQHEGGHTTGPNWPAFLQFASRYLHAPAARTASARPGV